MKNKVIQFDPKHEIDDYVYLIFKDQLCKLRIIQRVFIDEGDDDLEEDNNKKDTEIIHAVDQRIFSIKYILSIPAGKFKNVCTERTVPLDENKLFTSEAKLLHNLKKKV